MECLVEGRGGGQDRGDIKTLIVSFEGERLRAKKQCFLISVVGEKSKAWGGGTIVALPVLPTRSVVLSQRWRRGRGPSLELGVMCLERE